MIVSRKSPDLGATTHKHARERLASARKTLSESIQEYSDACQTMRVACSEFPGVSRTASHKRERALAAVIDELVAWENEAPIVQRARNMLLEAQSMCRMIAPIYSLPPEVLARIFTKAICWCKDPWRRECGPLVLASVCRQWRNVVLDNQSLWTHLDLELCNIQPRYPSPWLWIKRSRGAPISVHIHQYHREPVALHHNYEDDDNHNDYDSYYDEELYDFSYDDTEDDEPAMYDDHFKAPELDELDIFMTPLMQQVCSVTLDINASNPAMLERVLRATSGKATMLKVVSSDREHVLKIPDWHQTSTFYYLERLHLCNVLAPCRNWRLCNLTDLRLQTTSDKGYHLPMSQLELSSLLSKCPRLVHLITRGLRFMRSQSLVKKPALLSELNILDIGSECSSNLEPILAVIIPGTGPLHLSISLFESKSQNFAPVLREFLGRSNVSILHLSNRWVASFASQLGALPRVPILSLYGWYLTDLANVGCYTGDGRPIYSENPSPDPAYSMLWPETQKIFLKCCTLEKDHVNRLISSPALQKVYINHCYAHSKTHFQLDTRASDEYLGLLSKNAPQIKQVNDESEEWMGLMLELKGSYGYCTYLIFPSPKGLIITTPPLCSADGAFFRSLCLTIIEVDHSNEDSQVVDIFKFQRYMRARIEAYAELVDGRNLDVYTAVCDDVKKTISEIWISMPNGFGAQDTVREEDSFIGSSGSTRSMHAATTNHPETSYSSQIDELYPMRELNDRSTTPGEDSPLIQYG